MVLRTGYRLAYLVTRKVARVCPVGYVTGGFPSVITPPKHSVGFGTASLTCKVRYELDTGTWHSGKFGTPTKKTMVTRIPEYRTTYSCKIAHPLG